MAKGRAEEARYGALLSTPPEVGGLFGRLVAQHGPNNLALVRARVLPKLARDLDRIDAGSLPPRPLIAGAMRRA
jgi:hypothetical protein